MRLVAGRAGGRSLAVPPGVRPTSRRVREALFSIWGARMIGARVLDLFAGSGAVGAEALGRGAGCADFVEGRRAVSKVLRANLGRLDLGEEARVLELELPAGLRDARLAAARGYDLVFADPPYRFDDLPGLLAGVAPLLTPEGEVVVEHSSRAEAPAAVPGLALHDRRRYGESVLSFYAAPEAPSS